MMEEVEPVETGCDLSDDGYLPRGWADEDVDRVLGVHLAPDEQSCRQQLVGIDAPLEPAATRDLRVAAVSTDDQTRLHGTHGAVDLDAGRG